MSLPQDPKDILASPTPPIGAYHRSALIWALFGSLLLMLAILLRNILIVRFPYASPFDILLQGALLTALFCPILYFLRLTWLSRRLRDRVFSATGFLATFFGLAVLALFLFNLVVQVHYWFLYTPRFIENQNQVLKKDYESARESVETLKQNLHKEMEDNLAGIDDPAEKAEMKKLFEEKVIPQQLENNLITLREKEREFKASYREDTSTWGLFVHFLTSSPSGQPQDAGILPALAGSLLLAIITIFFAVPLGVGAALYLEEYRTRGWLGKIIQVNINNLAGVPSVVYGILGGYVFVEMIFRPLANSLDWIAARNALGGGLTLGLLTLPVVIVASQEAIRAVPQSIRHGSYALGATHWQTIRSLVLPMARPGILTGTILAISRAIGEAAPLVMFGALLFVDRIPTPFSNFTVMPMQIFGWADRPPEFVDGMSIPLWEFNAAMAILVLLTLLLGLNSVAIYLRSRSQRMMNY